MDIWPELIRGAILTTQLSVVCAVLATLLSLGMGFGLMSNSLLVRISTRVIVEVFRGSSLVVILFWLYFVLPFIGIVLDPLPVGIAAVSLNTASYNADDVRGAFQAVAPGQREAGTALSLSKWDVNTRIILPQALLRLIPPWGNMLIATVKNTAAVSLITISDLTFTAYQLNSMTFRTFEIFGSALLFYFVLAQAFAALSRVVEWRVKRSLGLG